MIVTLFILENQCQHFKQMQCSIMFVFTLSSDSKYVCSKIELPHANILVFDLVLYVGCWTEDQKHGICKHFLTYRNYYIPKCPSAASDYVSSTEKLTSYIDEALFEPGRTTVDEILRDAQFLSGCFFTGKFRKNVLVSGSMFYYHRMFCLHFSVENEPESSDQSKDEKPCKWLEGDVTYHDCSSSCSFTASWKKDSAKSGIWNMGHVSQTEKNDLFSPRLPKFNNRVRSGITFPKQASHIDLKDGQFRIPSFNEKVNLTYFRSFRTLDSTPPGNDRPDDFIVAERFAFGWCSFTLDQVDKSFYICDSRLKSTQEKDAPSSNWMSAAQIWNLHPAPKEILPPPPPISVLIDVNSGIEGKCVTLSATSTFQFDSEEPCGHAHLMSYLGVSIWEGELKDSEPSLPGNIENVSNYSVDIFSGNVPSKTFCFYLMQFNSDVLSSPDFGLAVLGFVAPRIASYKIWSPAPGTVPFPLAFLPWFLFLSQWGLLLAVFIQSIKECKGHQIKHRSFFANAFVAQGKTTNLMCVLF
jgi:hypothetical protein